MRPGRYYVETEWKYSESIFIMTISSIKGNVHYRPIYMKKTELNYHDHAKEKGIYYRPCNQELSEIKKVSLL